MKANLIQSISTAYNDYLEDGKRQHCEEVTRLYEMLVHPHTNNKVNPLDLAYIAYAMLEEASYMLTLFEFEGKLPLTVEESELRDKLIDARSLVRECIREHDKDEDFWRLFVDLTNAERMAARTK